MATYHVETTNGTYEVETDEAPQAQAPEVSKTESALRGAAQGLTLGHADEITGGLESLVSNKPYEQARDESRVNYENAQEAHPVVSAISNMAGSVPAYIGATALTGGNPVAGAALAGAVQGEGDSNSPLFSGKTLKNTVAGGVIGGVMGKAGEMVGEALSPKTLSSLAENQAAKAAGATTADFRKLGADKIQAAGRAALDNDVLSPFGSTADMAGKVEATQQTAWEKMKSLLQSAKGGMDADKTIADLDALKGSAVKDPALINQIDQAKALVRRTAGIPPEAEPHLEIGPDKQLGWVTDNTPQPLDPIPWEEANKIKTHLQKDASWAMNRSNPSNDLAQRISGTFRGSMEEGLEKAAPTVDDFRAYTEAKKTYGNTANLSDFLDKRAAREFGRAPLSVGDIGAMAVTGKPVVGTMAWKGIRQFGNQNVALGADAISKMVSKAPQKLGRYAPMLTNALKAGPQNFAVTHYVLSQQDPDYRQMLNQETQP